jgi:hypothetical protein
MRNLSKVGGVVLTLLATPFTPAFASPDSFACQPWFLDLVCGADVECRSLIDIEFECGLYPDAGDPDVVDTGWTDTGETDVGTTDTGSLDTAGGGDSSADSGDTYGGEEPVADSGDSAEPEVFVQIDTDLPGAADTDVDTDPPAAPDTDILGGQYPWTVYDTDVHEDWNGVVIAEDTDDTDAALAGDTDLSGGSAGGGVDTGGDTGGVADTGAPEACPAGDADGDGVCDDMDACPYDVTGDSDGDSVCDLDDLCPGDDDLADADQDTVPDCLDSCAGDDRSGDDDYDGLCNDTDACPVDVDNDSDWDGVCDSLDLCAGDDATGDRDFDGLCDDQDFTLDVARVGRSHVMEFTVGNALPGSKVYVLASVSGLGDGPCLPQSTVCVELLRPVVVARGVADSKGHATMPVYVPRFLWRQLGVQFQAAWTDSVTAAADVSNVVERTLQP